MLFERTLLLFLTFLSISLSVLSVDEYANRTTKYGIIVGKIIEVSNVKSYVFLGVPYAQPPVGKLRFKYPLKPGESSDVLKCTEVKSSCQQDNWTFNGQRSEDCLYLNIFEPHQDQNITYPVLVWIHGGSYFGGSSSKFPVNSTIKNIVSEGIIVVFVNYRLGTLGFLTLGNSSLPGNYGLEDQLFALKWVHENIHNFNGDPNRVTLTGESAGGASVSLLAISTKARGLFQQVVPQSGCSLSTWAIDHAKTIRNSEIFLQKINCTADENGIGLLACLQNVSTDKFVKFLSELRETADIFLPSKDDEKRRLLNHVLLPYFTPIIDKYRNDDSVLDDFPDILLKRKSNISMLIGTTNFEMIESIYMRCLLWNHLHTKRLTKKQFMAINLEINNEHIKFPFTADNDSVIDWEVFISATLFKNPKLAYQAVERFYKVKSDFNVTEYIKLIGKIISDMYFIAPAVQEATYYAKNNNSVYFYYYTEDKNKAAVFSNDQTIHCGSVEDFQNYANHGHDLARLFQSNSVLFRPPIPGDDWEKGNLKLTNILSKMITSFIKTGVPAVYQNEEDWSKFTQKNQLAFLIHTTNSKMIDVKLESNHKFWYEILPFVEKLKCS